MKNKSLCWIINSELFLHVRTCNSISPTETLKITHSLTFIPLLIQYWHLVFTVVHDPLTHKKCQVLIPAVVCCFVLYHVFHLFSLSGMETDTWVKPLIFISLHESTVRKHLRWNSLNASRVQNDPSWRKLHAFTLTLVLMTSVSTLSRYRLFLADLDSPPRAANRADPPVSHKHPKHKR